MFEKACRGIFPAVNGRKIRRVYDRLLEHYGPQGWWPTTEPGGITPRYFPDRPGRRLSATEQWETVVGSFLTQNTSWSNAALALENLAQYGCRTPRHIRNLPNDELAKLIRPARYFNQKARHLQELASYIESEYDDDLTAMLDRPHDELRAELLTLRGIGPETADSVLLYAAGHPAFVVDAFTRRVCARLGWVAETVSYAQLQSLFVSCLPADAELFNEYHALIVRHAGERCHPEPECTGCCLRRMCGHPRVAATADHQ